jgi:hypothetical protein
MKIDRSLFLVLTGTMAAVACGATQTAPPTQSASSSTSVPSAAATAGATPGSPSTASATLTAMSTSTATTTATATATATATQTATATATTTAPPPQKLVVDPSKQKPLGYDSGCAQSNASYDDTRTSCDDNIGPGGDCSGSFDGYPSNEVCPGPQLFRRRCNAYNTNFKPKVAETAIACLGTGKMRHCNSCIPYSCGHRALMGACPDASADADCDKIELACSGMSRVQCHSYLAGMTAKGRATMVDCLTKDCSKGFGKCLMLNVQ